MTDQSGGPLANLVKATLTIFPANDTGSPGGAPRVLPFHFNPKEYVVAKSASWARTDSQKAPAAGPVQWHGARPRTVNGLQIYLDRSDSSDADIVGETELLLSCCAPTVESVVLEKPSGPFVLFGWGTTASFTAIVTSVSVRFTMFRPNGQPYRAIATVNLEEVGSWIPGQNPTSGSLAARRSHTVVSGESLHLVAQAEYGKPGLWRVLAEANGIDDPMRVADGQHLLVPSREEAEAVG